MTEKMLNRLVVILTILCIGLLVLLGMEYSKLQEAEETVAKQEAQLKELYEQVNELTLQYVGIVRRLQGVK